jgi:hypothetical protein
LQISGQKIMERQEELKFEANLGYVVRSCLQKKKKKSWRISSGLKFSSTMAEG